jgi:glucose/arabinose dehydrogenase
VSGRRAALLVVLVALAAGAGCGGDAPASASAVPPALVPIGAGLDAPTGTAETVLVHGPIHLAALARDGSGRLWMATAAEDGSSADGVYVVPASGAAPVQVVDGLSTVLGLLWVDQTLYVASAAGVLAFSGFDGAHFSGQRPVVTLPDGVGEANGLAATADGRLWLGISAPCDHCTPASPLSASVVSFLPDGTDLRVEASGIRAPVGLVADPSSAGVLVTMNQRDDLGENTPGDWLAAVESGQAWGFPDCYGQGGPPCASAPSPLATLDPHAAVGGITLLDAQPDAGRGRSAVVAEWALGKVQRIALDGAGQAPAGTVETLLSGQISPMAVLAEPGGKVLVGDWTTGIVYEITPP